MNMRTYRGRISSKTQNGTTVLVFGSNTQGRHGKGMAKMAHESFGAIYGQPKGRQGMSYAIVTKDLTKKIHPSVDIETIYDQISDLYTHAIECNYETFYVPYTGSGQNLNAYSSDEMAKCFYRSTIPENIRFEEDFWKLIQSNKK
jgi:hypothetical protein